MKPASGNALLAVFFALSTSERSAFQSCRLKCFYALKYPETDWNFYLTRSLPRDVYIRRKNDHPRGQGRMYTSNLNLVFTHLSKPGHRRGCCCVFPRCLLRQFVDRCLLSWALFIEKQFFYASCGFCPNGGKQRCGCSQMRHKLGRAVRSNAFKTTAIKERAGFVLLKARATGMAVEIGWQRKLVTGAPGEKNWPHCSQWTKTSVFQLTVERPSSSRDRRYEYTSIVASETLRISCQENFKAGALRQSVGEITIIHLKDPRR